MVLVGDFGQVAGGWCWVQPATTSGAVYVYIINQAINWISICFVIFSSVIVYGKVRHYSSSPDRLSNLALLRFRFKHSLIVLNRIFLQLQIIKTQFDSLKVPILLSTIRSSQTEMMSSVDSSTSTLGSVNSSNTEGASRTQGDRIQEMMNRLIMYPLILVVSE